MRKFADAASIIQAVGSIFDAEAAASDLRAQARAEAIASRREIRDEQEQSRREVARMRAMLSAGGTDLGVIASLTGAALGESAIRQHRIRTDSRLRSASMRARASNTRTSGFLQAGGNLMEGAGRTARAAGGGTT